MTYVKISELETMQQLSNTDLLPIVDVSETETKKITKQNLLTDIDAKEVQIGQLTEATQINDEDYLIITQNGTNKKISKANAKFASGDEVYVGDTEPTGEDDDSVKFWIEPSEDSVDAEGSYISNEYGIAQDKGYSQEYLNEELENKQNGTWTLLQDNVGMNTDVDLSNIDFNEIYVVIRHTTDTALAITQNVVKSDLTNTIKWYRNGYYYNAQVNSALAVRASLTQINFTDYYVNGSIASATMNVYYR